MRDKNHQKGNRINHPNKIFYAFYHLVIVIRDVNQNFVDNEQKYTREIG